MFGCIFFITQFPSLNFRHSSLITLKYYTRLAPSLSYHHSIFFTLFVNPIFVTQCNFFFFFPVPKNQTRKEKKKKETQITRTQWKKEKKKEDTWDRTQEKKGKKKKRKKEDTWDRTKEKKENKKVDWSKGAAELWLVGFPCVFNYKNVIELWVMETENN